MSLARYLSKLAALVGSDGKVPAAGLASGAAVSNIGYTPVNKAGDTMTGGLTATGLTVQGDSYPQLHITSNMRDWVVFNDAFGGAGGRLIVKDGTVSADRLTIDTSGNVKVVGGNLEIASGKGIAFPATQSASSDANTLDDYEEGTWTPVDVSGASLSFSNNSGSYVKIGKQVFCNFYLSYPVTANGLTAIIGGLPFTASNDIVLRGCVTFSYHELNAVTSCFGPRNNANFQPVNGVGNGLQNSACSSKTFAGVISYYL